MSISLLFSTLGFVNDINFSCYMTDLQTYLAFETVFCFQIYIFEPENLSHSFTLIHFSTAFVNCIILLWKVYNVHSNILS